MTDSVRGAPAERPPEPTDGMIRNALDAMYPSHVQEEMRSDELAKGGRLWNWMSRVLRAAKVQPADTEYQRGVAERRDLLEATGWIAVTEQMPPRHETVLAKCSNGDLYQARVCYGMHDPWWCGHSELNFGVVLSDRGLIVTHWRATDRRGTGAEPTAGEEAARRRLWEAIQALRGRGVVGRAEIDLVDQRINEFAGALRAGGPPPQDIAEIARIRREQHEQT